MTLRGYSQLSTEKARNVTQALSSLARARKLGYLSTNLRGLPQPLLQLTRPMTSHRVKPSEDADEGIFRTTGDLETSTLTLGHVKAVAIGQ